MSDIVAVRVRQSGWRLGRSSTLGTVRVRKKGKLAPAIAAQSSTAPTVALPERARAIMPAGGMHQHHPAAQ